MKRIGVMTSGGDSPGMNAAVRAVVRSALASGVEVLGFRRGYQGIHDRDYVAMERSSVSNIIQLGGSIIYSSRFPAFREAEARQICYRNLEELGVTGLVAIGGDGTYRGAELMVKESHVKVIGMPGTIDNDIAGTDYTIGYDTAVNTALDAIDKIRDTASAMERIFFVEVMGRHSGYLALDVAVAGGADAVLVPELENDTTLLIDQLQRGGHTGKRSFIVVVAEGDDEGGAAKIAEKVTRLTGVPNWVAVIGYIQRGGSPSARDRVLASKLGEAAVDALLQGTSGVQIGEVDNRIELTPFRDTYARKKPLDEKLLKMMLRLSSGEQSI